MSVTLSPALTETEQAAVAPYFTNLDRPVFALVNLPETVKGALFARYSRSAKPLRRLFLDEFYSEVGGATATSSVGIERAERLYARVFNEYGDDSVAQLGGVHLAVENASNVLTKVLERGPPDGVSRAVHALHPVHRAQGRAWRYLVPAELDGHPLRARFVETLDRAFEIYARWIDPMRAWFERKYPKAAGDSDARLPGGDSRQGARHAARHAAGRDRVEPRHLRHGPGLRSADPADARASAGRGPRDRRRDARGAAEGHSGISHPRRSTRPRRTMDDLPGRHARAAAWPRRRAIDRTRPRRRRRRK